MNHLAAPPRHPARFAPLPPPHHDPPRRQLASTCTLLALGLLTPTLLAQSETTQPPSQTPTMVFAVRQFLPEDVVRERWQPTLDLLNQRIPSVRFELRALSHNQLEEALANRTVGLLLTNSLQTFQLVEEHRISPLLTLRARYNDRSTDRVGSIVITRADRKQLNRLTDLRNHSFAAVNPASFSGWLMIERELRARDLDPERDLWPLLFLDDHHQVVAAVRDARADAGAIRWNVLQELAQAGQIHLHDFKIIDIHPDSHTQPLPSTSRLYPEDTLSSTDLIPPALAREIRRVLQDIQPDHPAARHAHIAGWIPPASLAEIKACLAELNLSPFDRPSRTHWSLLLREHWPWFFLPLAAVLVALLLVMYLIRTNWNYQRLRASLERELEERTKAELALRESEAFYHSLVESLPQNILRKDREGHFTFANSRFCAELGKSVDQIVGKTDYDFFPRELAEKYRKDDLRVIDQGATYETVEEHIAPGGEPQYVQVIKSPIPDADGHAIGIQGIFWDVTQRKRMEEELRQSREQFELAMRGARDGIWDWDLVRNEVYFSPRWISMLGYDQSEIQSSFSEWERLLHPDDRDRALATVRAYLEGSLHNYEMEIRMRHKDGSYRWILTRGAALRDADGRPYRMAGSHTDITSRKEFERKLTEQNAKLAELIQSERVAHEALKSAQSRMVETAKLAGLGEMVAGVAHEINNPLAFVSNNIAVLQRDLADLQSLIALYREGEPALQAARPDLIHRIWQLSESIDLDYTMANLQSILLRTREGLKRIHQIVKDLRTFARVDAGELTEFDLNQGIDSTVNIVRGHAKKKDVTLQLDLGPIPAITGSAAKINQVIMNIVVNAIDASSTGGVVTIRSRTEPGGVRFEVEDRGTGIDPAIRERIFDPFFTTKPVGVGTGLGLSISYAIVQDHGGSIEVDSTPGIGTNFIVHLPFAMNPHRNGLTRAARVSDVDPDTGTHSDSDQHPELAADSTP